MRIGVLLWRTLIACGVNEEENIIPASSARKALGQAACGWQLMNHLAQSVRILLAKPVLRTAGRHGSLWVLLAVGGLVHSFCPSDMSRCSLSGVTQNPAAYVRDFFDVLRCLLKPRLLPLSVVIRHVARPGIDSR